MSRRLMRRSVLLVFAISLLLPMGAASQGRGRQPPPPPPPAEQPAEQPAAEIYTGSDQALEKMHPRLREEVETAEPSKDIWFVGRMRSGTNLDQYTERWVARNDVGNFGFVGVIGYAKPAEIVKIGSDIDVFYLQRAESVVDPPKPVDSDVQDAVNATIEPSINMGMAAGPAPTGWYHTGMEIHGSQQAWSKGFTGQGVIYMSNDSGADYCHPDLEGTYAYDINESSPYYGLPLMYDSFSTTMLVNDLQFGTTFVADGVTDYADTSATTTGATFSYAPIGSSGTHTFATTGTSLSGEYHYGSHPDKALALNADILGSNFGDGTAVSGQRAAVLVVDENEPGVYDTVYVDLNYNYDFSDDEPARLARDFGYQETACLDYNADGLNDVSGGLVYFIADGVNAIPTQDWSWGLTGGILSIFYGNGDLVAFHVQDFSEGGGTHGQGTTSVATGQGVVTGSTLFGPEGPPQAEGQGLVVGPGKDVKSTQNGNFYVSFFIEDATLFGTLGYDGTPGTADDTQIISNSWGNSATDNDGWDPDSRLIDFYNRAINPFTTQLFSTGNGAAGYGTTSPPSPSSAISVGASTLFDTFGLFEPIGSADQIIGGDPMSWSNRGPGAVPGWTGVDIVATGAFGTGDLSLNEVLNGAIATEFFSGTSMAAPVAAGNLALMFQAWFDRTGEWPTFDDAKLLIQSSATHTEHDVWTQGAGLVNADLGTDIAFGGGGSLVSPSDWPVGDYRGEEYPGFGHIIHPGASDTQTFSIENFGATQQRLIISPMQLVRTGTDDYSMTSMDQSIEHGEANTPDYLIRIDENIPAGTNMIMVRLAKPYDQFDPNNDLNEPYNNWRVMVHNWTDLNGNGQLWIDANGNGKVDLGEMDAEEYIRFTYGYNTGPTQQARVGNPLERMDDGIFIGLQHRDQVPEVPMTDLTIEVSYFQWQPWDWVTTDPSRNGRAVVTVAGGATGTFDATVSVPANTPYGMYQGALFVEGPGNQQVIPVNVAVASDNADFTIGGQPLSDLPYDNSHVFGYTDYNWRAESGDWRFFWTDLDEDDLYYPAQGRNPAEPPPESASQFLVVDNQWTSPGTDIDTIILGPTPDENSAEDPEIWGPYTEETVGSSQNRHVGSGRWQFQTSSGGPREIVSAPVQEGLHGILLHQVKVDGNVLNEQFEGDVGIISVNPGEIEATSAIGSAQLEVTTGIPLSGLVAEGFGFSEPTTSTETIFQDDPDDPTTASFVQTITLEHAARLDVSTCCTASGATDIDLFLYGPDGELIGSSTTPGDEEFVSIIFPEDGEYTIAVHGWSVTGGQDTFELMIDAIQGTDLSASGVNTPIPDGGTATVTVAWNLRGFASDQTYSGVVLLGPPEAPGLLQIPVTITLPPRGVN